MAHEEKQMTDDQFVTETKELFRTYSQARQRWATHAKEDKEFRLGKQWSKEQQQVLENRGQAPVVVNRIHPAVEAAKAMLTANRPSFRCAPREDSDNKMASVMSALLTYMYDISDGRTVVRQVVDDYYVCGVGYMQIYQDPMMDMGKGEVCIHDLDPLDVYVDPNCRSKYFDDAENIIVSRLFTKEQAKRLYPMYAKAIENASGGGINVDFDRPDTGKYNDDSVHFPEDVGTVQNQEYIRGYERYYPVVVDKIRTFEKFSGKEELLEEESFEQYVQRPAWIIEGQIFSDQDKAMELYAQLQEQIQMQQQQIAEQMAAEGFDPADAPQAAQEIKIEETTFALLIEAGQIEIVRTSVRRIKQCVVMGDVKLYERILPIEKYPVVPFVNTHTRTPYPVSDVRMVKGVQEYINKTRSLIIAHATTSTNTKILVPEGSVDMREFEQKWAQPGVAIPYDPTDGAPMPVQPSPLPNELYNNETTAKNDIDHQLGLYEMMMGNSSVAPQTYKATISIDEFGQRKMKSKLADIEGSLVRVGEIAIPLMQQLYKTEKTFRIVQPNNSLDEYVINKRLVDDKTPEIKIFNDITVGKYDVIVVTGSTLPSNRYAELEFYMEAYKNGLIDRVEVLKKTEIFDKEGVMQRFDYITQLEQQLEEAAEQIKDLEGDLQTRDRENVNLKQKVEVEKFKSGLDKVSNKASAAGTLYEKRLDDSLASVRKDISDAKKPDSPRS
tara:strand:- start:924 stop:3095 length:2172 start_codon:yes stop_codon:yes gene_type:complete